MNKTLVVTGGTKGIGRAIIEIFAKNDFTIFTCSRNQSELNALKEEIESNYSIKLYCLSADLSKKDEVKKFADYVMQETSAIDVLVNNTGVFIPGSILEEEDGSLEQMMNTNLFSAYYLTRFLKDLMLEHNRGHIFSMSSIAGITAYNNGGSYSITKYAMQGFTKCLREEMKEKGIKVTAVLPGATYTASWEGVDIPLERFMKSEDVAEAVWSAYKMSPNSVVEEIVIRPQLGDL